MPTHSRTGAATRASTSNRPTRGWDRVARNDHDRDGIANRRDRDMDNDGIPNHRDADRDGDRVPNWRDHAPDNRFRR